MSIKSELPESVATALYNLYETEPSVTEKALATAQTCYEVAEHVTQLGFYVANAGVSGEEVPVAMLGIYNEDLKLAQIIIDDRELKKYNVVIDEGYNGVKKI